MDGSSLDCARPLVVKLALTLLGVNIAVASFMSAANTRWMDFWSEIDFWFFLLLWTLPFCFLVLGKNWARWLVVILTILDNGISVLVWERFHQTFSFYGAVWFWLTGLIDFAGVVLLFHPSSNRWFRRRLNAAVS